MRISRLAWLSSQAMSGPALALAPTRTAPAGGTSTSSVRSPAGAAGLPGTTLTACGASLEVKARNGPRRNHPQRWHSTTRPRAPASHPGRGRQWRPRDGVQARHRGRAGAPRGDGRAADDDEGAPSGHASPSTGFIPAVERCQWAASVVGRCQPAGVSWKNLAGRSLSDVPQVDRGTPCRASRQSALSYALLLKDLRTPRGQSEHRASRPRVRRPRARRAPRAGPAQTATSGRSLACAF